MGLEPWHVQAILSAIQEDQAWSVPYIKEIDAYASKLIEAGPAHAFVEGEEVYGCMGVMELEPHRAISWTLIRDDIGRRFFRFHKSVLSLLGGLRYQRIELVTHDGHRDAERWAEMLGFSWEGCMQKYFPNGTMGNLYARVK